MVCLGRGKASYFAMVLWLCIFYGNEIYSLLSNGREDIIHICRFSCLILYKGVLGRKGRRNISAGWSSLVARRAHNPEVIGSNPVPATKNNRSDPLGFGLFYRWHR